MPITSAQVTPVFTFADEGLIEYEKIASKKLQAILTDLDLGEGSNLQFNKQTFLPDDVATISYTAMEGVLEPIILVDVRRQPKRDEELEEEIKEEGEKEIKYYYVPSFWCGITTRNHTQTEFGQVECLYQSYPPEGRLVCFEPRFEETKNYFDSEYGWANVSDSRPARYFTPFGVWDAIHGGEPGADYDVRVEVAQGTDWEYKLYDDLFFWGFFGYQDWMLGAGYGVEWIILSEGGVICTENSVCYYTTPADARRPLFQPEVDFTVFDEDLSEQFWQRSIIVPGIGGQQFGVPDINTGEVPVYQVKRPCIFIGEDPGDVPDSYSLLWESQFDGSTHAASAPLPGEYEINPMVESYSCECFDCEVIVRLMLGKRFAFFEEQNGEGSAVEYRPIMEIVDIEIEDLGGPGSTARFYYRDLALGGWGGCFYYENDGYLRGGLNSTTPGWWQNSIYVNPNAATWRIGPASFKAPFYNDPECPLSPLDQPTDPGCIGCVGDSGVCEEWGICSNVPYCLKAGPGQTTDIRGLAVWNLAKVSRVDSVTGRICEVQLLGNDGGQGGPCAEKSFSYQFCWNASGIDPDIPLGSDLSEYPDQGIIGGWVVGELVAVIGYTNACTSLCDGSADPPYGDFRWLVTKTQTPTDDFTALFWSQLRCPEGIGFETFLDRLIQIGKTQQDCGQLAPDPVTLKYEDGCIKRVDEGSE